MKQKITFLGILLWSVLSLGQTVTTFAGAGSTGHTDATGTAAKFFLPVGVAVDASGTVYVADSGNHKIRKISSAGVVTTLSGLGLTGAASFYSPRGVAVDASGTLYVADSGNHKIRKISSAGVVTTLAGSGTEGSADATGTAASFSYPDGIAVDASGNVYVADTGNHKIRKISSAGVVTTLAGSGIYGNTDATGTAASFYSPSGVAVDASGTVYVADTGNHKIRKISSAGVVTTLAGSGKINYTDSTGTAASFYSPRGVAVDASGNVYVADTENHRIRKISPLGVVTTFAGSNQGFANGIGIAANFSYPRGVALDTSGSLYVGDTSGHKIRKITINSLSSAVEDIAENLVIYPNPATHFVIIEINGLSNAKLQLLDFTGKELHSQNLENTSNTVDMTTFVSGVYLFKITATEGSKTTKVIKN